MVDETEARYVGERLLAITVVEVGASAAIQTLLTAKGVTIHPRLRRLTLVPAGTVYMAMDGAASANSMPLAAGVGYEFGMPASTDVRLYAAGATNVSVVQES